MFGPELGRNGHRHPGSQRDIDQALIDSLGVHIDFDSAAAFHHPIEHRFPEVIAPFGYAALAMDAKCQTADRWTRIEHGVQRVTAVSRLGLRREP